MNILKKVLAIGGSIILTIIVAGILGLFFGEAAVDTVGAEALLAIF